MLQIFIVMPFNNKTTQIIALIKLPYVIKAIKHLDSSLSDFKVVIAGENYESMSKYYNLINKFNLEEKFMFDLKFIDQNNTAKYFMTILACNSLGKYYSCGAGSRLCKRKCCKY